MKYLIDHQQHLVHLRVFAGDPCGFSGTSFTKREFSDCGQYIENLVKENYGECPHCKTVQTSLLN